MNEQDELDQENTAEIPMRAPMAVWKKALAALSLVLGGTGVALGGVSSVPDQPIDQGVQVASSGQGNSLVGPASLNGANSLSGSRTIFEGAELEPEPAQLWAPLLAKGGLSFFIAFCIGYALRTFLKGTMLVIGVVSLAVFGLHKAGIVTDIDWSKVQGHWDSLTANLGKQFGSFKAFVAGSLPAAGSGGIGLAAGFKR